MRGSFPTPPPPPPPAHVDATTVPCACTKYSELLETWEGRGGEAKTFRFRFRGTSSGREDYIAVTRVGLG